MAINITKAIQILTEDDFAKETNPQRPPWKMRSWHDELTGVIRSSPGMDRQRSRQSAMVDLRRFEQEHSAQFDEIHHVVENADSFGRKIRAIVDHCLCDQRTLVVWDMERFTRLPLTTVSRHVAVRATVKGFELPLCVFALNETSESLHSLRTKRGLEYSRKHGLDPRYNKTKDARLLAFTLWGNGKSFREIARILAESGFVTSRGNPVGKSTVAEWINDARNR